MTPRRCRSPGPDSYLTLRRGGSRAFGWSSAAAGLAILAGCAGGDAPPPEHRAGTAAGELACEAPRVAGTLPGALREASGVTFSLRDPGVLWSHNDSGHDPELLATDTLGNLLGRVRVTGADNVDWEDIAAGPCEGGGGACLYIADTGDNLARRSGVVLYRVPEPAPDDTETPPVERFPIRYPEGPRDAEALAVSGAGEVHILSKGRTSGVVLYRYPPPLRAGREVELERVWTIADETVPLPVQVTGASRSPDGRWLAVRTYVALHLYRVGEDGSLRAVLAEAGVPLTDLGERQGEGVALRDDGLIALTSEGLPGDGPAPLSLLRCRLP